MPYHYDTICHVLDDMANLDAKANCKEKVGIHQSVSFYFDLVFPLGI